MRVSITQSVVTAEQKQLPFRFKVQCSLSKEILAKYMGAPFKVPHYRDTLLDKIQTYIDAL